MARTELDKPLTAEQRKRFKELNKVISNGLMTFVDVGLALLEIRNDRLYREQYTSFPHYVRSAAAIEERHANQLCDAGMVVRELRRGREVQSQRHGAGKYPILPSGERVCRPLARLGQRKQSSNGRVNMMFDHRIHDVWSSVINEAEQKSVPVTAGLVKHAVEQITSGPRDWTTRQERLQTRVIKGYTVVINMHKDLALLDWAEAENRYVRIDRFTPWGNPFVMDMDDKVMDGNRDTVCDNFEKHYWPYKPSLHAIVHDELRAALCELRGRVLGCHCAPKRCHGDFLAALVNQE